MLESETCRLRHLNFRNNLLLLYKNLPDSVRTRRLFIRRLYDTLAWGMFMLTFDFKNANAVLKAHRDFRKMKKNYTQFPSADILPRHPNIIIQYYLLGRHKFSQLKH